MKTTAMVLGAMALVACGGEEELEVGSAESPLLLVCGNGKCDHYCMTDPYGLKTRCFYETPQSCPQDCTCGNGRLDPGEACDPTVPGSCPTSCTAPNTCAANARLEGSSASCSAICVSEAKLCADILFAPKDDCCPAGCKKDPDCGFLGSTKAASCGDGVVSKDDESCDSGVFISACPQNACYTAVVRKCESCNMRCYNTIKTTCTPTSKDGCCPVGCTGQDKDCETMAEGTGTGDSGNAEPVEDESSYPG